MFESCAKPINWRDQVKISLHEKLVAFYSSRFCENGQFKTESFGHFLCIKMDIALIFCVSWSPGRQALYAFAASFLAGW